MTFALLVLGVVALVVGLPLFVRYARLEQERQDGYR